MLETIKVDAGFSNPTVCVVALQRCGLTKILPLSPLLVDEQLPDEVLGQLGGLGEELVVELVVAGHDVGVRLLLGLAQEGGGAGQTAGISQLINKIEHSKQGVYYILQ